VVIPFFIVSSIAVRATPSISDMYTAVMLLMSIMLALLNVGFVKALLINIAIYLVVVLLSIYPYMMLLLLLALLVFWKEVRMILW